MPLDSYESCPSCGHKIILTKGSDGSFRCSDCQCEFRHNFRKWAIGIPVVLTVTSSVGYLTNHWLSSYGQFLPFFLGAFFGFGVSSFVILRIPSYIITQQGSVPVELPKR